MTKSTADYSHKTNGGRDIIPFLNRINQDYVRNEIPISLVVRVPGVGEITCSEVFRSIQGKRLVCLGETHGSKVIVKLYFSAMRARANWKRSHKGCSSFIEKHIPAPGILFSGFVPEYGFYAMVFEYLTDAVRIDSALETCRDTLHQSHVLDSLMNFLAGLHEQGLLQNDLHLGNFMIKGECIYALDGDQITARKGPVGKGTSLRNLARLLANIPTNYNTYIETMITSYLNMRGWEASDEEMRKINDEIRKARWEFLSEYLSKINRTRDPFLSSSGARYFSVFDRHHTDVEYPDILEAAERRTLKKENSGVPMYSLVPVGTKNMLVWSSASFGPLILRRFWVASRVWKNALMLRRLCIGAPHPVAIVFQCRGMMSWNCFVFFKPLEGVNLKDLFTSDSASGEDKEIAAAGLADALALMNGMGIFMGRISPEEIFISGNHVIFLGLDGIDVPGFGSLQRQPAVFRSFLSQWQDMPEIKDIFMEQFRKRKLYLSERA
jgi:tRNA A-37 threonylcarbamoyl transferase component Bud32